MPSGLLGCFFFDMFFFLKCFLVFLKVFNVFLLIYMVFVFCCVFSVLF